MHNRHTQADDPRKESGRNRLPVSAGLFCASSRAA
jgi:hypothetical protein